MRIKRYIVFFLTWVIYFGTIFSQSISTLDDDGTEVSSLVGYPCGDLRTIRISDPSTWTTTFSSQPYCLWQRSDNQGLSWQNLRDSGEDVFEIKVSNDDGTKQLYRVIIANDKTVAEEISMIGIPTNTVIPYAITNEVTLECSLSFCGSQEDRLVVWKEDFNSVPRGERRTCENLVDKKFAGYYNESSSTNVGDGKYAVVSHVEDGSIPSYNWFSGGTDHTGNKDGGFLIINNKDDENSANKLMFEKKVEFDLCPDTWYYFSIYAMCITGGAADNPNRTYAPCNFRFEIIGEDGVNILADAESGDVPVTPRGISTWYNYGVSFNSGTNKNVILRIYDNAKKGVYGNDMAIDDISLIACHKRVPNVQLSAKMDVDEEGVCGEKTRLRLSDLSEWKLYYDKIYCLWQTSIDGGLTWENVTGGFDTTYIDVTFKKTPEGVRYRVIFAADETEANQIAEKGYLDNTCHPYAISNVSTLTCHCEPLPITLTPQDTLICKSATITLTPKVGKEIDEELEYEWYYKEEGASDWTVVAQENGTTTDTIYSKTYDITPSVNTQYFAISKSASCGGDHTDTITVSLIDSIRFDLTLSKDIICEGESVSLSVENINPITSDFVWSSSRESASGFSPISQATGTTYQESPSESTIYVVSAKMAECASQSDTVRLTVMKTADFDLKISKETICLGESIQIDVENGTAASSDYTWSVQRGNATTFSPITSPSGLSYQDSPTEDATYVVSVAGGAICPDKTDTVRVKVVESDQFDLTISKETICKGESVSIAIENGTATDYEWTSKGASATTYSQISNITGSTYQDSPTESMEYVVSTKSAYCPAVTDTVRVEVVTPDQFDLTISKEIICKGESVSITIENGTATDYEWASKGASTTTYSQISNITGTTYQDSPAESMEYVVSTKAGFCPAVTDTVRVEVVEPTQFDLTISKDAICKGESVTLAIENGTATEYEWSAKGASATTYSQISNVAGITYQDSPTESMEYVVSTKTGICPAVTDTVRVEVVEPDQFDLTISKETICKGESVTLAIENGTATEYEWSAKGASATTYSQISNVAGITYQDSPTESMEYVVSTKAGICPAVTDTVRVEMEEPAQFDLSISKDVICKGESVTITVENSTTTDLMWTSKSASATTYSLISNVTGTTYQDSPSESMVYVVSSEIGICPAVTDTIRVEVAEQGQFDLTISKETICKGESVTITIENGTDTEYEWSYQSAGSTSFASIPNVTGATYQATPDESATYVVSTKSLYCPVVTDTVRVKVEQPLVISATSDQTTVCVNSRVHFNVEASDYKKVTFVRYPEKDNTSVSVVKNFTGTEQGEVGVDDEVTENMYYELRQTEGNSCPDASPVVIRIMTEDSLKYDAVTQVLDICQGAPVELSAKKISGEAKNFSWKKTTDGVQYDYVSDEEVTTVYPMESCEYWLTAESEHCGTIAQQIGKINLKSNNKKVTLMTSATNVCEQDEVTLTTQYEDGSSLDDVTEIVWYRSTDSLGEGEVVSQAGEKNTEKQIQADETAYYSVQYVTQGECSAQYSEKVKVEVEKKVQVNLQAISSPCMGMEFPIKVQVEGNPQRIDFYQQLSNGSKKKYDIVDGEVKVVLIEKSLLYMVEAFGHYCPSSSNYLQVFPDKDTPLEWTTPDDTAFCEYQYIHFDAQYEHIEQLVWEYAEEGSDSFTVIDKGVDRIDTLWTSEKATSMTLRLTAQTPQGCFRKEKIQTLYMDMYYRPASWNVDTIICKGDEVTLTVNPNDSNYRYEWREYDSEISDFKILAAGPTFTLRPEKNGSYSVDAFGKRCETSYGYDVILDEPMKIETEIIDKRSIALQVSGGYGSYQYDLGEGYGTSNVIEDFDYIRYYQVKVRDELGCVADTVIKVHEVELRIPEFFTPQGDGVNDVWLVENLNYYKGVTVRIYDRMGKLLFETKNPEEGWNGEYMGHAMPSTDYWYEVYIKDIKEVYSGHFTLIRK